MSWGNEIVCHWNEIIMSWERGLMSLERAIVSWEEIIIIFTRPRFAAVLLSIWHKRFLCFRTKLTIIRIIELCKDHAAARYFLDN